MAGEKNGNGIAGILIGAAVPAVIDIAKKVADKAIDDKPHSDDNIKIPELYRKGFLLDVNQAIELLESYGLKGVPSKVTIKEAAVKYKDYSDNQVIDSSPKQGTSVKPGTIVYLKYITADVIDASQKIFDDIQQTKEEAKARKVEAKREHREKVKNDISKTVDSAKNSVGHAIRKIRKVKEK